MSGSSSPVCAFLLGLSIAVGCGASTPAPVAAPEPLATEQAPAVPAEPVREAPPASAAPRDMAFPPRERFALDSGLPVDLVRWTQVPIVYTWLVVTSGDEADPADQPGIAQLVASMLKEGSRTRTSAALAEQIEFLGADLFVSTDQENTYVTMRSTSEHFEAGLELLADAALNPAFRPDEWSKLKRRELDRLALSQNDAQYLAQREFNRAVYGSHPYAHVDTTPAVVERLRPQDLAQWHRAHFLPNNAFLIVVGDIDAGRARTAITRYFGGWRPGAVPSVTYCAPPARSTREVVLIDRPESAQSVIWIGNLATERASADYIPLLVANQVLGGSAASRLFMDLRERRSMTYGAYSWLSESVKAGVFRASASVRNDITGQAVEAFFEHLNRIRTEAIPEDEIQDARRYLSDSFPLEIDTPGKIAGLLSDVRVFGLPENYWDGYRSAVRAVTPEQATRAATRYIDPEHALILVVGRAADVLEPLRRWGAVRVIDKDGQPVPGFAEPAPPPSAP